MMLLFDIDGTLVSAGGAGRIAMARAFEKVLGVTNAMDGVRLNGSTDPCILEDAYQVHVRRTPDEDELDQIMESYFTLLEEELTRRADVFQVLPGAQTLLEAASQASGYFLGLATGNAERGARIKLKRGALNHYFSFGGFGSDAKERTNLVRFGMARGHALAEEAGLTLEPNEVVVLGDTERDVQAGRAAGAVTVGVLSGSAHQQALEDAKPDLLVESLEARQLWDFLRL